MGLNQYSQRLGVKKMKLMKQRSRYDHEKVMRIALFMIENKGTLRQMEERFGISKTTLHNYLINNLKEENYAVYLEVRKLLDINKAERTMRGAKATRKKYLLLKSKN